LILKYFILFTFNFSFLINWAINDSVIVDTIFPKNELNDIVLIKNDSNILPLKKLDTLKIATLNLANKSSNRFEKTCDNYYKSNHYHFNTFSSKRVMKVMKKELESFSTILIISDTIHQNMADFINSFEKKQKVIFCYVGQNKLPFYNSFSSNIDALLYSPNKDQKTISFISQLTFGGYSINNKLKHSLNDNLPSGLGKSLDKIRLSYGSAKDLKINDSILYKIDSIALHAIQEKAMPGCQVLAAKNGHVFFHKSFGNHTYDSNSIKVSNNSIYDLASITKIISSAFILMDLESKNNFNIDSSLGHYLPKLLDSTEYKNLIIKDILTHQAGLVSWIPFFFKTLDDGKPSYEIYSKLPSSIHQNRVAENLYVLNSYRDTIFKRILDTKVRERKKYKYSDLGYYFVNQIIKEITKENQDDYIEKIYHQLGLKNIGYHPRKKWDINRIPPTENDTLFRHQLIHGDVHDQGAALLGGVGGHAGVFSNANDLAVIMQLFLNGGTYGGDTLISPEVIKKYTSSPFHESNNNRRGIAFDKPVRDGAGGPTCFECASYNSFGHSGFTGNLTWADPDSGILYVFLSNRVHPDAENHKLISMNVRTEIMKVITDACRYSTSLTYQKP
tara:strand:+ start:1966 stop:3816 length:1851 start_codon:yes stop_codon:yes gene_type:complete